MFEPENDIERLLVRASAEPAARPGFARALMESDIFLVLVPDGGSIVPGPDGNAVIPEGVKLIAPAITRDGQKIFPLFTAPSRARVWYSGDHIVHAESLRTVFTRHPDDAYVLNPGSDYGKEFTAAEVRRMLAGQFDEGPQTQVIDKPEQVLLAHPKEKPVGLIAALARELGAINIVSGAWLMLAMRAGASEQSWMLGVDHKGSWQDVRAAIGRAVASNILNGWMLDAMPLDAGEMSVTLRGGIPILTAAPKRGFLQKLFR
jgi:SseB protein C-terminal domain/SseB protein N-terminal domain